MDSVDLRSLVRTLKFTDLQQRAERDPSAKRPPTIMFLGVAFLLVGVAFGFAFLLSLVESPGSSGSGQPLDVPDDSSTPTNETTPTPTSAEDGPGPAYSGPESVRARTDP